ncbi:hypothetical protein [Pseudovibrio brasiliensis]|nr:hypothetical protein [Pseudovibrio brasiliensis]
MRTSPVDYHRKEHADHAQSPWPVAATVIAAFVGIMFMVLFVF